jgi:hypothetical protein
MKKLIYTIFASLFLLSCTSDSANEESNNSTSTALLVKTVTDSGGTQTINYNGNKITNSSSTDGSSSTFTYNGNFIIAENTVINNGVSSLYNYTSIMSYSNNLLSSYTQNGGSTNYSDSYNQAYTYNANGSITENINSIHTNSSGITTSRVNKYIRFYSQGNCIKVEDYRTVNGLMTLTETITYTYDTNNFPFKNITGFYTCFNPIGFANNNNKISETHKNASGIVTSVNLITYQYNSQNYPISSTETYTGYIINPQTGTSTPGTPTVSNTTFTYY